MASKGPFSDLSVSHRVLLWLYEMRSSAPRFSMPVAFTQKGISAAVGASQNFISVILKQLIFDGLAIESKWHVEGSKRKMKVFQVTPLGAGQAQQLAEVVRAARIRVLADGKSEAVVVGEYLKSARPPPPLSRIILECMRRGYYSKGSVHSSVDDGHRAEIPRMDTLISGACEDLKREMKTQ